MVEGLAEKPSSPAKLTLAVKAARSCGKVALSVGIKKLVIPGRSEA